MRKSKNRVVGFEKTEIELASGDDAWPAFVETLEQQRNAPPPLEAEAQKRKQKAAQRIAYWRKRIAGVISKEDESKNFEFWNRRTGEEKEEWHLQRKEEVRRVSEFFKWADANGRDTLPPAGVFREGSYDFLLARWLVKYREYEEATANGRLEHAVSLAFFLGEISERIRWRFGKDEETGKRK